MEVTKAEIQRLENKIQNVDKNVASILEILTGQELDSEDKGLIGDIRSLKGRVSRLEKFKDRMIWLLIGMSIPAGYGITELISHFINK